MRCGASYACALVKYRAAVRDLIEVGRELWQRRLVTGTSGNLSARLDDGSLIMTRAAVSLRDLNSADLIVTDGAGKSTDDKERPTSEYQLHVAAYRTREDINVALHTHPTFCVVWSKLSSVLPRDTVGARETLRDVVVTPYLPPGTAVLAGEVATALKHADNVLMERHGFLAVSSSIEDAFLQTDLAEEAARIAYFSRLAGFIPND